MESANKPLLDELRDRGFLKDKNMPLIFDLSKIGCSETQIFVLSPEVALAAETLVRSKSFVMPDISELRFPYPHMAIEMPLTPEVKVLRKEREGTYPINRLGIHIDSDHESGLIHCAVYWEYAQPELIEPPLLAFTIGDDNLPFPSVAIHSPKNPTDRVSFKVLPSRCLSDALVRAKAPPEVLADLYREPNLKMLVEESASELPIMLFAASMLLTCKTGIQKTKIAARTPPIGLKLGARKKKQMSSSSYTVIHLQDVEQVSADGHVSQKTEMTAHYVRGHFKQRSSGVYWWNPFVRGTGELKKRIAYSVKNGDELENESGGLRNAVHDGGESHEGTAQRDAGTGLRQGA